MITQCIPDGSSGGGAETAPCAPLEDGYVYWGSNGTSGALSAWQLRALADELDKRNKEWDTIIQNDPRIG